MDSQRMHPARPGTGLPFDAIRNLVSLRLGLVAAGLLLCQTGFTVWLNTESFWGPVNILFNLLLWCLGIGCLVCAMLPGLPKRAEWLILSAMLVALWGLAYIGRVNYSPALTTHTDNEMIAEYSVAALEFGQNPYGWNYSDAAGAYREDGRQVTTFLDGARQHRLTYPALSTLVLFAFDRVGLGEARWVGLIFHSLLLILVFVGVAGELRPLVILPFFACRELFLITLNGLQDAVWSTLLVGMILVWKQPALRAILFGLACAYRQQPWLVAPFLLIQIWNETPEGPDSDAPAETRLGPAGARLRAVLQFALISLGIFLIVNSPFMLWDFRAWVLGVFEPAYASFNVYSHGVGTLAQYDLLPLPREFFTGLQISAFAIMLLLHWRHPQQMHHAFWILPGVVFWLQYRGLANYWLFWIPPLIVAVARSGRMSASPTADQRWQPTVLISVCILIANLVWGVFLLRQPPAISADFISPLESMNGFSVARIGLEVTNQYAEPFEPRFSVQHDGLQPLPWEVESGPRRLAPGETGHYIIYTTLAWRDFPISRGAQVVVSDAGGDYSLRVVITIPPDPTFASPDLIVNPSFNVWLSDQGRPAGWSWSTTDPEGNYPQFQALDGRTAVLLAAPHGIARLSQTLTLPDSISIWVRPDTPAGYSPQGIYGLEIHDGAHQLWILFGDREGIDRNETGFAVVHVRAPLDQWSRQTIHPAELYQQLGWALPTYSIRTRQGLQFAARQARLSLLVADTQQAQPFGAFEQDPAFAEPRSLVDHALAHPDEYYLNLGNEYCRQRNFELAQEAFRIALEYNPDSLEVSRAMDSCP